MKRTTMVIGAAGDMRTRVVKQLLQRGYDVTATVLNDSEEHHLRASAPGVGRTLRLDLGDAQTGRTLRRLLRRPRGGGPQVPGLDAGPVGGR